MEYGITLENISENLNEESIVPDENVINLARQAFGDIDTLRQELIFNSLTKN